MSANGISHLPLKKDRQAAKLALAATDRTTAGNARDTLDDSQLPTTYGDTNAPGDLVDNDNSPNLTTGRPWV